MTANIQQRVVPRRRQQHAHSYHQTHEGAWQTRPVRARTSLKRHLPFSTQRGSVTQGTVTVAFSVLSLVILALLGFFYLQQIFSTASQGSDIQALESRLVELKERQRELELQGAELRSIQAVEDHVKELNLVSVGPVAYLADSPGHVAVVAE